MNLRMWWKTTSSILMCCTCLATSKEVSSPMSAQQITRADISQLATIPNIIDIAVIGSGPAGCSAALQCAHLGFQPEMFAGQLPGGLISETGFVENWAGMKRARGIELMAEQREQAVKAGVHENSATITRLDCTQWPFVLTTDEGTTIRACAVILATGAHPRMLNVPGENTLWGHGVSACAVCDAPLYEDKNVVVIGGGDSATEQALHLAQFAKKVTIIARADKLRAAQPMQEKIAREARIGTLFNYNVTSINGTPEQGVSSIELSNNKTHGVTTLPTDGVFLAIGHVPNTGLCAGQVTLHKDGRIVCKERSQETSVPGLFAAGDVESTYRQAACAAGSGCAAAIDSYNFLCAHGLTPVKFKKIRYQKH